MFYSFLDPKIHIPQVVLNLKNIQVQFINLMLYIYNTSPLDRIYNIYFKYNRYISMDDDILQLSLIVCYDHSYIITTTYIIDYQVYTNTIYYTRSLEDTNVVAEKVDQQQIKFLFSNK